MKGVIDIDRFSGELKEPKEWKACDWCGDWIHEGQRFYIYEDMYLCDKECLKEFAVNEALINAKVMIAGGCD